MRTAFAYAFTFIAASQAAAQKLLPFKVYVGHIAHYDIVKGVNTIRVNDGFIVSGTIPVSPTNTYRLKPGQALALLYASKAPPGSSAPVWGDFPHTGFNKVIRKVDGQEVEMENYPGVSVRFESTQISKHDDAYHISRNFKSKFNPPLPASDFDRTQGIFLMNSSDVEAARKEPAFAKDVNKVAGKVLKAYYLVSRIDGDPFFSVEVDFTGVQPASLSSAKTTSASDQASNADAQKQRDERAAGQQQAAADRAEAKKQREEDRAAAKEAKAEARAEAAAERAKKRAEAAAARKTTP